MQRSIVDEVSEKFGPAFRALDFIRGRKRAYQSVFSGPAGETVLADLAKFCRAAETCVVPGDRDKTFVLEGRREVFLRIGQHLGLTSEQLYALYTGKQFAPTAGE